MVERGAAVVTHRTQHGDREDSQLARTALGSLRHPDSGAGRPQSNILWGGGK